MSEEKSDLNLLLRLALRILSCIGIGVVVNIGLLVLIVFWCSTFFPVVSMQSEIFVWTFIFIGIFLGTCLAGHLSRTFERSIITTAVLTVVQGFIGFWIAGVVAGIITIIVTIFGGLIGGGLVDYLQEKLRKSK